MSAVLIDQRDALVINDFIGQHHALFAAHVADLEELSQEDAQIRADAITDKLATDLGLS